MTVKNTFESLESSLMVDDRIESRRIKSAKTHKDGQTDRRGSVFMSAFLFYSFSPFP